MPITITQKQQTITAILILESWTLSRLHACGGR